MTEIFMDHDGYEYQPSETSERAAEPTPHKSQRMPHSSNTQESLMYSASSQETNRLANSINSPNFTKPNIYIHEQDQQPQYLSKLRQQFQPQIAQPQIIQPQSQFSNIQQIKHSALDSNLTQQPQPQLPKVVSVSRPNSQQKIQAPQSPTPVKQKNTTQPHSPPKKSIEELESLLIQERLNSEQLRVYNHIIKLELEKKLHNLGVFIVNGKNRKKNENAIDIYIEIQRNRVQMHTLQNEFKQKDQIIAHLENQLKQSNQINELMRKHEQELQAQNEELSRSVQQAMSDIALAQEGLNQLEQEKDALLDYIEQQKSQQLQSSQQFDQMAQKYNDIAKELNTCQDQIKQLKAATLKQQTIEQELSQKQQEIQEAENIKKTLSKAITDKQKEIMQYQLQLTEHTNKLIEAEQMHREMSRQLNDSMHQISMLRKQNEEQQSQIHILNENIEQINYDYESNASKTGRIMMTQPDIQLVEKEQLIRKQQSELESILQQNQQMQKEFQQLLQVHQQLGALTEKHQTYVKHTEELRMQIVSKDEENLELVNENSELKLKLNEFVKSQTQLQIERQQILEEMESTQTRLYTLDSENKQLLSEIEELNKCLNERIDLDGKLRALEIKYQAEVEYYEKLLKEQLTESSVSIDQDTRLTNLQRIYEKLDRILFNHTSQINQDKPSRTIDGLIAQISDSITVVEGIVFKHKHEQSDKFFSNHGSVVENKTMQTTRYQDQTTDVFNIKQIQLPQSTIQKRKYFL